MLKLIVQVVCLTSMLNQRMLLLSFVVLRALSDFEYEFQRALFAKYLDDDIETVFIMTNNKYSLSAPLVFEN